MAFNFFRKIYEVENNNRLGVDMNERQRAVGKLR